MELKQIKELMAAMDRTCTTKLSINKEGFELTLEREQKTGFRPHPEQFFDFNDEAQARMQWSNRTDQALSHAADNPSGQLSHLIPVEQNSKLEIKGSFVTSPMVGTFYLSPSPDDSSFVKVGDRVEKNTLVCIIEAMKVMNEIKANLAGTIVEVLIESGQPVEFGTKLFRIVE